MNDRPPFRPYTRSAELERLRIDYGYCKSMRRLFVAAGEPVPIYFVTLSANVWAGMCRFSSDEVLYVKGGN
jgi:hypothetical protein